MTRSFYPAKIPPGLSLGAICNHEKQHEPDALPAARQTQDEDTTAAVVYVLSHTLGVLPLVVLRSKFAPLAEIICGTVRHPDSRIKLIVTVRRNDLVNRLQDHFGG